MSNIILGDGALGTELRSRGVEVPSHTESIWSALALTENPDEIKNIHLDYIEAGSDFITINNYAVTRPLLARLGREDEIEDLTLKSIELAEQAIKESYKDIMLAGSLPPLETSYRADLIQDREPLSSDWDITFTKYSTDYPTQQGTMPYSVTGVLQNNGIEVAEANNIASPSTYTNYNGHSFLTDINEIGYDWKYYDFASGSYLFDPNT